MSTERDLEQVAALYREEGYTVQTHPDSDHLPLFAAGFGADLLAKRSDGNVLVRVKRDRSQVGIDPDLPHQATVTNAQPGWRYDLVVLEHDNPIRRIALMAGEPSVTQIGQTLGEAERTLSVSPRAAFLLTWGGLEAALRRVAQRAGVGGTTGTQLLTVIRELYSSGLISPEDFQHLEQMRSLRAEIAHGFASPGVDEETVRAALALARRLLAESEKQQVLAG